MVLDLDNTLIHARNITMQTNNSNGSFWKMDKLLDIYGALMRPYSYEIKCRPFLKEFMLGIMPNYEIYFYTAGIREYGKMVIQIIKNIIGDCPAQQESLT